MSEEKESRQKKRVRSFAYFESYHKARKKLRTYKERALFDDNILNYFFDDVPFQNTDSMSSSLALALELVKPTLDKSKQRSIAGKNEPSEYEKIADEAAKRAVKQNVEEMKKAGILNGEPRKKKDDFPERQYDCDELERTYSRNG